MPEALDTTSMRLTAGQKAWLAVKLAAAHDLTIGAGIALTDTVAHLLPQLPPDTTRRCHCGESIGINEFWCSDRCYREDEGPDRERDLEDANR